MAAKLLEIPDETVRAAVDFLPQDKRIVARTLDTDAGPLPAVFLAGLDLAEKDLARRLVARLAGRHPCPRSTRGRPSPGSRARRASSWRPSSVMRSPSRREPIAGVLPSLNHGVDSVLTARRFS
jgi:hypothetical protein